jgi:peptidoglycan biosynthesis protein MviN/MurJ (putative lipid II flippase)
VTDTTFDTAVTAPTSSRRERFRASVGQLAERSTSTDLIRWMLIPGSLAIVLGFVIMALGWYGASHTAREIEQIPYLISGGLVGLGLVIVGALLLASTFWVAVTRKLLEEVSGRR